MSLAGCLHLCSSPLAICSKICHTMSQRKSWKETSAFLSWIGVFKPTSVFLAWCFEFIFLLEAGHFSYCYFLVHFFEIHFSSLSEKPFGVGKDRVFREIMKTKQIPWLFRIKPFRISGMSARYGQKSSRSHLRWKLCLFFYEQHTVSWSTSSFFWPHPTDNSYYTKKLYFSLEIKLADIYME